MSPASPLIALVAGEISGDNLGAGLMQALKVRYPNAGFVGIGGPAMQAQGLESLYPMERLSLMGISEVLPKLPGLLAMRRALANELVARGVQLFVGIDAPDFNLGLELRLHRRGIRTVHYVSPSVWAWRQGRVHTIAKGVDLMLTLLPFEADFYQQHAVPVQFVGHRLAHLFPLQPDVAGYRKSLAIGEQETLVALLPGSRRGEVKHHLPTLLATAEHLQDNSSRCYRFLVPAANSALHAMMADALQRYAGAARITLVQGRAREVMGAADVVVVASGTVTMEAMLLKRPMVVFYKAGLISYHLISPLIKVPFVSLPNLLAGEALVPELIQSDATPEAIAAAVERWLDDAVACGTLQDRFLALHKNLRQDSDVLAASAIIDLLEKE